MTDKQIDEIFSTQDQPTQAAIIHLNVLNYKLSEFTKIVDRLLKNNLKKENVFNKVIDLKAAIDSAAIHVDKK